MNSKQSKHLSIVLNKILRQRDDIEVNKKSCLQIIKDYKDENEIINYNIKPNLRTNINIIPSHIKAMGLCE